MIFVDRERESHRILKALDESHHVIVTGSFGIGRTSLLRRIAASRPDRWRFIFLDFERPAAEMGRFLFAQLFPRRGRDRRAGELRSPAIRFRIANWEPEDSRRHVLVLDNIAALSPGKLGLIRQLAASKRFNLVAIAESFLPGRERERLRTRLAPAPVITLGRLSYQSARQYFDLSSRTYALGWSPDRIAAAAAATQGYPLGMWEAVNRARKGATIA